jgi:mannosyltransferase
VDRALAIPAAVTLAVMLWGIRAPSYRGDEVDTVSAVSRSLPQLIRLLGHTDAVHGLYYLLLWPVARVAGTGEMATRLPSALAMTAAALGVSAIARRLRSRRGALSAGLVFAALPAVTQQGHDARPYAMLTAAVVLASYLLVRLAGDPQPGRFACYGLALVLVGYLQVFGLLIVPAHAITLLAWRRRGGTLAVGGRRAQAVLRGWLPAVAAAGVLSAPAALMAWLQRGSVAWIKEPGWYDARYLLAFLGGGSVLSAVVMAVLAGAGAGAARAGAGAARADARAARADAGCRAAGVTPAEAGAAYAHAGCRAAGVTPAEAGADRRLFGLALPWLVVPPALLWAVSFVHPAYSARYVTFCLPATALLAGAALAALRAPVAAAALGLLAALSVPGPLGQRAVRVSGGSTGAAAMQAASRFLAAHERPGDAVVYPGNSVPPLNLAYPAGFGRLRDLSLAEPGAAAGRLYGVAVRPAVLRLRERGARRIWVAEIGGPWPDPAGYVAPGFRLARRWESPGGSARAWLYAQRR